MSRFLSVAMLLLIVLSALVVFPKPAAAQVTPLFDEEGDNALPCVPDGPWNCDAGGMTQGMSGGNNYLVMPTASMGQVDPPRDEVVFFAQNPDPGAIGLSLSATGNFDFNPTMKTSYRFNLDDNTFKIMFSMTMSNEPNPIYAGETSFTCGDFSQDPFVAPFAAVPWDEWRVLVTVDVTGIHCQVNNFAGTLSYTLTSPTCGGITCDLTNVDRAEMFGYGAQNLGTQQDTWIDYIRIAGGGFAAAGGVGNSLQNFEKVFKDCNTVTLRDQRPEAANGVLWVWNWGDGTTQDTTSVPEATHYYRARDIYTVQVSVQDRGGSIQTFVGPLDLTTAQCQVFPIAQVLGPYILALLILSAIVLLAQIVLDRTNKWTRVFLVAFAATAATAIAFIYFGWSPALPGGIQF